MPSVGRITTLYTRGIEGSILAPLNLGPPTAVIAPLTAKNVNIVNETITPNI
jgi:hypothetical protein